jgi:hypothetical protein
MKIIDTERYCKYLGGQSQSRAVPKEFKQAIFKWYKLLDRSIGEKYTKHSGIGELKTDIE